MKPLPRTGATRARAAFTLAEVAVTMVIVGIGLLLVLQGLSKAKTEAVHTRDTKAARDFALLLIGEIESGLYQEELGEDTTLVGTFAELGRPDFGYEVVFGDENFVEENRSSENWDSWTSPDEDEEEDPDERAEEAYEKVRVRVTFPVLDVEMSNKVELEKWVPWEQVYGKSDEELASESGDSSSSGGLDQGGAASGADAR